MTSVKHPIGRYQKELDQLSDELHPNKQAMSPQGGDVSIVSDLSDDAVMSKAWYASNGEKFQKLWNGDINAYHNGDHSSADLAMMNILALFTQERDQLKRLFLRSELGKRDKAKREDYLNRTIDKALDQFVSDVDCSAILGQFKILQNDAPEQKRATIKPTLDEDAFHGVAGELVKTILPHSEGDPAAFLFQLLVAIGCVLGRDAFFLIESTRHYPNLFMVLVGNTSKARKGTSWNWIRELLKLIAPIWFASNVKSGLASGEGLLHNVRDAIFSEIETSGNLPNVAPRYNRIDPGVSDKRLLIIEQEMSKALTTAAKAGSTLSEVIREAWDTGDLQTLSKHSAEKATDAHISIVGQITSAELRIKLSNTDMLNGFGNRFLWVCAERSKLLPHGGNVSPQEILIKFASRFQQSILFATKRGRLQFTEEAKQLWAKTYYELSVEHPDDLYSSMTARADPQIVRISLIYALLDCSPAIEVVHLRAAKAVWDYCDKSCRILFGKSTGNSLADKIESEIVASGVGGLSRTDVSRALSGNKTASEMDVAIGQLISSNRIRSIEITSQAGRPEIRYFLNEKPYYHGSLGKP